MKSNDSRDLQRTPQFTQPRRDIPIPEQDLYDPVAEYNRGEIAALEVLEKIGFSGAHAYGEGILQAENDIYSDFIQGYFDTLEFEGTREI